MKNEFLIAKFSNLSEVIGHIYDKFASDNEAVAKKIDESFAKNAEWKQFKAAIRKGDELYLIQNYKDGAQLEGYSIVRNKNFIKTFLTIGKTS